MKEHLNLYKNHNSFSTRIQKQANDLENKHEGFTYNRNVNYRNVNFNFVYKPIYIFLYFEFCKVSTFHIHLVSHNTVFYIGKMKKDCELFKRKSH